MCICVDLDPVVCKAERYGHPVQEYLGEPCGCICHKYEKYSLMMAKYAFNLCEDRSLAWDFVHDVFVALLDGKTPDRNVKAYLFTAIYNLFVIHHRKSKRFVSLSPIMTDKNSVEDVTENRVLMALIFRSSKSLTKKMRHSFVLDMAGLSVKECMSLLGVRSTQVRNQRRRAIQKLRKELNDG